MCVRGASAFFVKLFPFLLFRAECAKRILSSCKIFVGVWGKKIPMRPAFVILYVCSKK